MTTLQWLYQRFAGPTEGQNAEPGDPVQKMSECVYACVSVALQLLGYHDTEPTDLMNLVHPGGHIGGESFAVVATYLRAHPELWPHLPPMALYNPPDTLAAIDAELAAGHILILDVWDDRSANILDHPLAGWGGTHAVMVEAKDAAHTVVWNPWLGEEAGQTFPNSYIRGATLGADVGNFFVFQRDIRAGGIEMLSDDVLVVQFQLIQSDCFGLVDPSGQAGFLTAIKAGVAMNAIKDGWMTLPQAKAYQTARAALVATTATVDHLPAPGADPAVVAAAQKQLAIALQKVVDDLTANIGK